MLNFDSKEQVMTKTDLFRVTLKILGLFSALYLLDKIWTVVQIMLQGEVIIGFYLLLFGATTLNAILMYLLLFRTDFLISFFKLNKGYESESMEFQATESEFLIRIGLVLMSLYLIIVNLPYVLLQIIFIFKNSAQSNSLETSLDFQLDHAINYPELFFASGEIVIAFLVVSNSKLLAAKINHLTNKLN